MKFLIVYSSKTGNTEKVAKALYSEAPEGSVLAKVNDMPDATYFDVVFIGYWMDRGSADEKTIRYLRTLGGKKVVLFETMGADPKSEHAYTGFCNAAKYLDEGSTVLGVFAVQGAVDPALIQAMKEMAKGNPHNSSAMEKTVKEAAKHPDDKDLANAKEYMDSFKKKYEKYYLP